MAILPRWPSFPQLPYHIFDGKLIIVNQVEFNLPKVSNPLVEGLEVVPELDDKITLKILVGLDLAFHQNLYPLSRRIMMLAWRLQLEYTCPRDSPKNRSREVQKCVKKIVRYGTRVFAF